VEMADIMRKDSSGLKDCDEEDNFAARRANGERQKKSCRESGRLPLDS
jgi:hypothetical protein